MGVSYDEQGSIVRDRAMIKVACPHCSKPLGLPPTVAGKTVKCPNCKHPFAAPKGRAPVGAAVPRPAVVPQREDNEFDEATPYGVKAEELTPEAVKKSASLEAVDEMVIAARRTRKRNKAWDEVGLPAKWAKRTALTMSVLWLMAYLFMTMIIVLGNHNMEQAAKQGGFVMNGGVRELPKYIFIDSLGIKPQVEATRPVYLWLYCTGALAIALAVYGLQLAGAESMKRLEDYGLVMAAMIVGSLTVNLFCIWGLLALMSKDVQFEFRVSARRKQGISGEELYREDDDEEEESEEGEEDEEEDPEEDEKATARPAARRRG